MCSDVSLYGEMIRKRDIKEVRDRKSKRNEMIELEDKAKRRIHYCLKRTVRSGCGGRSELVDRLILWQALIYRLTSPAKQNAIFQGI